MKRLAILATMPLAACAGLNAPRTVTVKVPVAVPCTAEVPAAPVYADARADQAPDIFEQVKMLLAGREQRKAREKILEGAVVGCGGVVK